jgi:hypothetical protein
MSDLRLSAALRAALIFGLLLISARLHAAEGGFGSTLSIDQQTAAGLIKLSAGERAALDQLVAMELALVRQSEPREFTGMFASRRTEAELKSAGLDRLTPAELTKLNELVAAALSARPKPKERPRIKDSEVFNPAPKPEIHGSISLTYGGGTGGRNFYGASLWVDYFNPATGLGLGVGVASYSSKGFSRYYPGYFGSRYYSPGPFYLEDSAFDMMPRDSFPFGVGQSFLAPATSNSSSQGYWRH